MVAYKETRPTRGAQPQQNSKTTAPPRPQAVSRLQRGPIALAVVAAQSWSDTFARRESPWPCCSPGAPGVPGPALEPCRINSSQQLFPLDSASSEHANTSTTSAQRSPIRVCKGCPSLGRCPRSGPVSECVDAQEPQAVPTVAEIKGQLSLLRPRARSRPAYRPRYGTPVSCLQDILHLFCSTEYNLCSHASLWRAGFSEMRPRLIRDLLTFFTPPSSTAGQYIRATALQYD